MSARNDLSEALWDKATQGDQGALKELLGIFVPNALASAGVTPADAITRGTTEVASLKFAGFIKGLDGKNEGTDVSTLESWLREIGYEVSLLDQARNALDKTVREKALTELVMRKIKVAVKRIDGLEKYSPDIEAEDVILVTCFKACKGFGTCLGNLCGFESWLHRIAKHTFLTDLRALKCIKRKEIPSAALELMLGKPLGPRTNLEVGEMMRKAKNRFGQLPRIHAQVLMLHCFEGLDPKEIAKQLPLSEAKE